MTHNMGITNEMVCRDNLVISREKHFVAIFDWSQAKMTEKVDPQKGAEEIAQLAIAVTLALGGNPETGALPQDPQGEDEYRQCIRNLALGKEGNAQEAHSKFYATVHRMWPKEFYPFTTFPLVERK